MCVISHIHFHNSFNVEKNKKQNTLLYKPKHVQPNQYSYIKPTYSCSNTNKLNYINILTCTTTYLCV